MPKKKRPEIAGVGDRIFGPEAQRARLPEDLLPLVPAVTVEQVPLGQIDPNPYQPRGEVEQDEALQELAASIKERGVLQPIRVRPHDGRYQLIAGERRWRASQLLGLDAIPAIVVEISDEEMRVESIIENLQREDLNDMERARALRELKQALGLTWDEVAARVGLTRRSVMRIVGLTTLPESIQEAIARGELTEKHGRALRQLKDDPDIQLKIAQLATEKQLSGDDTAALVTRVKCDPRVTLDNLVTECDPRVTSATRRRDEDRRLAAALGAIERSVKALDRLRPTLATLHLNKRRRKSLEKALGALAETVQHLQEALEEEVG